LGEEGDEGGFADADVAGDGDERNHGHCELLMVNGELSILSNWVGDNG
jgi:hypothetical protein